MRLLLTWSDRSLLQSPSSHHGERPKHDRGPVLRLLEQEESRGAYDAAWVLTTPPQSKPTETLVEAMRTYVPEVDRHVLPVDDPSDHEQLFRQLLPIIGRIPEGAEVTTVLSAGTPQAQTLWVLLVKSGMLPARMVQVVPPAFVPHPHPKAVREVTLDIPGFPEIRALREEVVQLRALERARSGMVGSSPAMHELVRRIARVGPATVPVLVLGETGTGKELVARAVHAASNRAEGPFLAENCGALPEGTLASELFGHEKGAFSGAIARRRGLFELAHGGTLFLDEIGEAGPQVQAGLLRALEQGTVRRVGGEHTVHVDVRIVAATHRDLRRMVAEGRFREDLYYRLEGAVLEVPPLRARIGDLEGLVAHFAEQLGVRARPTREAWQALQLHDWPGNVRELRAEVARWAVFCEKRVELADLSAAIRASGKGRGRRAVVEASASAGTVAPNRPPRPLAEVLAEVEQREIAEALSRNGGNLARTARELGIDRNTLKRKLRR